VLALAGVVMLAGCGGGERQDAHEPSGTFPVAVDQATFPPVQALGSTTHLVLTVRNTGSQTIPNLAVTVDGLNYRNPQPGLSDPTRPLFIVDNGPGLQPKTPVAGTGRLSEGGYVTAYTNTWASGPLAAGKSVNFTWAVTPVLAGRHTVTWTVAAGLNGKAQARTAGGAVPAGHFVVLTTRVPTPTHVDPATGQVVAGPAPNAKGVAATNYLRATH
jgi:hypothetical protein